MYVIAHHVKANSFFYATIECVDYGNLYFLRNKCQNTFLSLKKGFRCFLYEVLNLVFSVPHVLDF